VNAIAFVLQNNKAFGCGNFT